MEAGLTPFAAVTDADAEGVARARAPEFAERGAAAPGFAENLHEVPALLVLLADLRNLATLDRDLDRYTLVGGASIYPFAWSLLLAAHDAGLGGVITTVAIREEVALRRLFAIPEPVVVAGVLALGVPGGQARDQAAAQPGGVVRHRRPLRRHPAHARVIRGGRGALRARWRTTRRVRGARPPTPR